MHATDSDKKNARIAGFLYLVLAITGAFALMYVPSQIIVRGDAAATANNILANEILFRAGIVSHLVASTIFVFLVLHLYRLFRQVSEHQARLMVALVIVSVPVVFVIEALNVASLMIVKDEVLQNTELALRQDLSMLLLRIRGYAIVILEVLWGLWLIPFGRLVYLSQVIPRVLGILLIVGGMCYVLESLAFVLSPDAYSVVSRYAFIFFGIAEISMIFWLLIVGVRTQQPADAADSKDVAGSKA